MTAHFHLVFRYHRTNSNFAGNTSVGSTLNDTSHPTLQHTISSNMDEGDEMLWKLVEEAETNLVAYSEEVIELSEIRIWFDFRQLNRRRIRCTAWLYAQ